MLDHSVFGYAFIGFGQTGGEGSGHPGPSYSNPQTHAPRREAATGLRAWLRALLGAR